MTKYRIVEVTSPSCTFYEVHKHSWLFGWQVEDSFFEIERANILYNSLTSPQPKRKVIARNYSDRAHCFDIKY